MTINWWLHISVFFTWLCWCFYCSLTFSSKTFTYYFELTLSFWNKDWPSISPLDVNLQLESGHYSHYLSLGEGCMPQTSDSRIYPSYETLPWHCKTISVKHSVSRAQLRDTISITYHRNISPRKLYQVLSGNTSGGWSWSWRRELSWSRVIPERTWRRLRAGVLCRPGAGQAGKVAPVSGHCTDRDTPAHPGVIRTNISSPSSLNNGHPTFQPGLILQGALRGQGPYSMYKKKQEVDLSVRNI